MKAEEKDKNGELRDLFNECLIKTKETARTSQVSRKNGAENRRN